MISFGDTDPSRIHYRLRLFIAGTSFRSQQTVENLHNICAEYLADRYDLEIIDIYQQPELAEEHQVVAAPTLLRLNPQPLRRIVGDLSDKQRVLHALALKL